LAASGKNAMTGSMKAIEWDGNQYPQGLSYQDFEIPEPPAGWVLVHNRAAGICGSDLHYLLGYARDQIPEKNFPAVLGHENAGVVVQTGEGVTEFKPGDRVAVEPLHGCTLFDSNCPMCQIGKYHLCLNGVAHIGLPFARMLPGGYGEYSIVHRSRLYPIPGSISFKEASLLDILAVGVHAVNTGQPALGDRVVVFGCGVIGLDLIQCLHLQGTRIIAIARHAYQAEMAQRLGAAHVLTLTDQPDAVKMVLQITNGRGADQVYECVGGEGDTLNQAVAMCRMGGRIIMVGEFYGLRPTNLFDLMMKEVYLFPSNGYSTHQNKTEFQVALDLLQGGNIDHKTLVSHCFDPQDFTEAIDVSLAKKDNHTIKALFVREG
jgi:L-iditol 2-dehydrogenase